MANPGVYISYAWKDVGQNDIAVVDQLDAAWERRFGFKLQRDYREIGYAQSIRAYMDRLTKGSHVIVILSDAYLKSESCMYELVGIYRNEKFRERVSPIVLDGTRLYDAPDQIAFRKYWEDQTDALDARIKQLRDVSATQPWIDRLDGHKEIIAFIPRLLAMLGDMNALSPHAHLESDFDALFDRIGPQTKPNLNLRDREPDEQFRSRIVDEVRVVLKQCKPLAESLQRAVSSKRPVNGDLAEILCSMETSTAVDDCLRKATMDCLRGLQNNTEFSNIWWAAKTVLVWLGPMSVDPEMVKEIERQESKGLGFTFELGVNTKFGVEIASARYRQIEPKHRVERGKADVSGAEAFAEPTLETGWNDDDAVDMLLLGIWKHIFPEDSRSRLSDFDVTKLRSTLMRRERNKSHHHYIPVALDEQTALSRPEFYKKVMAKMPELTVIYFNSAKGRPALCIPGEVDLMTIVREFLSIPEQLNKRL